MPVGMFRRFGVTTLCLVFCAAGCASKYQRQSVAVIGVYEQGKLDDAAAILSGEKSPALQTGDDQLLWLMEKGKVLHDLGRFQESNTAFSAADQLLTKFDQAAKLSVSQETKAALLDQTFRQYQGTMADRIMVSAYLSLNYFAMGNLSEAHVHARRAHDRQVEALDANAKAIAKAENDWQTEAKKHPTTSPTPAPNLEQTDADFKSWVNASYADYANPLASYVSGLLCAAEGDYSNARVDFQKVYGMVPQNHFVHDDLENFETDSGQSVFVIFENGMAPQVMEKKYPYVTPWTGYSAVVLPNLEFEKCSVAGLAISGQGINCKSELLASINGIVAKEFQSRFKIVVVRTVLSLMVKETATAVASEKMRRDNNTLGQAGALVLGSLWKAATSNADTRSWRTMPGEIQLARCARPADGVLKLALLDHNGVQGLGTIVKVPDAPATIIFVRSVNSTHLQCVVAPINPVDSGAVAHR